MRIYSIVLFLCLYTMPLLGVPEESSPHVTTRKKMTKFFKKNGGKALVGMILFLVGGVIIVKWQLVPMRNVETSDVEMSKNIDSFFDDLLLDCKKQFGERTALWFEYDENGVTVKIVGDQMSDELMRNVRAKGKKYHLVVYDVVTVGN